jgi:3-hydroxyisobutyrate dehydrogenase
MQIAFIGLGNMGTPMAANLVRAGHSVQGFDLSQAAMDAAHAVEVPIANSADNAVQGADCVITMLPAGHHVLAAVTALLGAATQDALFIDCSTIDVESARFPAPDTSRLTSRARSPGWCRVPESARSTHRFRAGSAAPAPAR